MNYNEIQISTIPNYSHTAQLALCIEHIGAALTQLRVNNRVKSMPKFYQDYNNYSILCYAAHIGGTLEDRMADMALGLIAFAKQNNIEINVVGFVHLGTPISLLMRVNTFLCYINNLVCNLSDHADDIKEDWMQIECYIHSILNTIELICRDLNIDLPEHIRLKQEWLKMKEYE